MRQGMNQEAKVPRSGDGVGWGAVVVPWEPRGQITPGSVRVPEEGNAEGELGRARRSSVQRHRVEGPWLTWECG